MSDITKSCLVVSRVMSEGNLKGFLLVDAQGVTHILSLANMQYCASQLEIMNAQYDSQYKTLVGINGQSLTDCPEINENYELTSRNGISVFCIVKDKDTKDLIGVVAYNGLGSHFNLTFNKLDELSRRNKPCNFEMYVDPKYGLICRKKDGTPFDCVEMVSRQKKVKNLGGCVKQKNNEELPMMTSYDMQDISNDKFSSSCQQKLVQAALSMQQLTPYYFTIYSTITRKPAPIETIGVTEDTLYYGNKFVAEEMVEELVFVLIHEILHMMMQHSLRFKPRTNHDLWNVACDLYINTLICNDFGCKFGGGVKTIILENGQKVGIKAPDYGVFEETFGRKIDFTLYTPETIYAEMLKNASQSQNQSQSGGSSQGSKSGSQGKSQQNSNNQQLQQGMQQVQQGAQQAQQNCKNSSQSQQASQQIQQGMQQVQQGLRNNNPQQAKQGAQQMQQGINQMNQAQQQSGQGQTQQGQGASQQMQSGMNQINSALNRQSSGQGQGNDGTIGNDVFDDGAGEGSDGTTQKKTISVTYNGKTVDVTIDKDVMSNNNSSSQGVEKENLEASRKTLQRAKTKLELEEEERGEPLTKNAGAGAGLTQRYIEVGLASGVDWRILLKNLCKDKPKKTFTLAQPNTDYMNLGMTLADRRAIGKPTHISHTKFAIDVSGSVSSKELNAALSEINQVYKHFKVDGELIYWSTMIGDAGNFSSLKDMMKVQPIFDGGTDVRCVFDYLAGKTKVHGRRELDKPRDITAIFIITDGCFSFNFDEYAQMFGKKVVWLITGVKGNLISFNPPFGRVIPLSLD